MMAYLCPPETAAWKADLRTCDELTNRRWILRVGKMLYPTVDPDTVKRKLRFDYLKAKNDPASRPLDGFTTLLQHFLKPHLVIHDLAQESATYIQKQFRLRWTLIGFRCSDGMYRYDVMSGMRDEAWVRHKSKTWTRADFMPTSERYDYGDISKLSRVYLEEQNPLLKEDEQAVNRPALLRSKRDSDETCLEADFIDTLILGSKDEMLGWIEYSGTIAGEFPDPWTVRNIEVISAVIGAAIASRNQG